DSRAYSSVIFSVSSVLSVSLLYPHRIHGKHRECTEPSDSRAYSSVIFSVSSVLSVRFFYLHRLPGMHRECTEPSDSSVYAYVISVSLLYPHRVHGKQR